MADGEMPATDPKECIRCGHAEHIGFWPGCAATWVEPDGWTVDCGCREYAPRGENGDGKCSHVTRLSYQCVDCADEAKPEKREVWWVIEQEPLLEALRRCAAGESADIVLMELTANADVETIDRSEDEER